MADIFEEIDEDLRQDQVYQWWKKYNKIIIPVVIILCLLTGAYFWWQSYSANKLSAAGADLRNAVTLVEDGKTDEAKAKFEQLNANGGATGMLAGFELAKLAQAEGDTKGAIAHLDKIADDSSIDALYRDRAKFMSLLQQMPDGDANALFSKFEALASPAGTYRFSAREMMGVLKAKSGDAEAAKQILTELKDMEGAPTSMTRRVDDFLKTLN